MRPLHVTTRDKIDPGFTSVPVVLGIVQHGTKAREVRKQCRTQSVPLFQNIFPKGGRTSLNFQYFVLFKNPRDQNQIKILAPQVCGKGNTATFLKTLILQLKGPMAIWW